MQCNAGPERMVSYTVYRRSPQVTEDEVVETEDEVVCGAYVLKWQHLLAHQVLEVVQSRAGRGAAKAASSVQHAAGIGACVACLGVGGLPQVPWYYLAAGETSL